MNSPITINTTMKVIAFRGTERGGRGGEEMCCTNPRLRLAPSWTRRRFPLEAAKVRLSARLSLILMISMVHDGVFFLRSRRVPGTAAPMKREKLDIGFHMQQGRMHGMSLPAEQSGLGLINGATGGRRVTRTDIRAVSVSLIVCLSNNVA